ncbi:MAG: glycoside hydrolase TIM-barrel-like domain-containing protein, partial [Proteobacteria bacterium]|nr:glycoside hydrolase TIM-barrel-like domain-containing protein [Pseudomonadota bacterium]
MTNFFNGQYGYTNFILHYAHLVKDYADAFIIGSEFVGLTKVHSGNESSLESGTFPAVDEFIALAAKVKNIVGTKVKVSYAADWSEYHHTDGGWYNLDPLWDSDNIDFVGIDAYFPLTSFSGAELDIDKYNIEDVIRGWNSGEGFDFYYQDATKKEGKTPLGEAYAWKNIEWWWSNNHVNPDGMVTKWRPRSKKIWFTEYGFPSIDCATNQPNVFYDSANSRDSGYPIHSSGQQDMMSQRVGIEATERRWVNCEAVENKFLWTWDARPYPTWPDRKDIWSDAENWTKGHWVQGKLGNVTLSAILEHLCLYAGLSLDDIDTSGVHDVVDGIMINQQLNIRSIMECLQSAYFFDCIESEYKLKFISRTNKKIVHIHHDDLVALQCDRMHKQDSKSALVTIHAMQEADMPAKVDVNYLDRTSGYVVSNQVASRMTVNNKNLLTINLPMVLTATKAHSIANTTLYNAWTERYRYSFALSMKYAYLKPSDVVCITLNSATHNVRITNIEVGKNHLLKLAGVAEDVNTYQHKTSINADKNKLAQVMLKDTRSIETSLEILDIPLLPHEIIQNGNTKARGRILIA